MSTPITFRHLAIGLAIIACLLAPLSILAQQAGVSGTTQGTPITVQGRTYLLLPDVRAVRDLRPGESGTQALRRLNLAGRTVLEEKHPFLLFRESSAAPSDSSTFAVVLNPDSGGLAVLPGTVIVKLKSSADSGAVATDLQLTIANRFDHLRLFFFRPTSGQDFLAALAALRADPRVESADPEVLEFMNAPN